MVEDSYDINNGKLCVSWVKFYFLFLLSDLSVLINMINHIIIFWINKKFKIINIYFWHFISYIVNVTALELPKHFQN